MVLDPELKHYTISYKFGDTTGSTSVSGVCLISLAIKVSDRCPGSSSHSRTLSL